MDGTDGTDGTDDTVLVAILAMPRSYALDVSVPAHVFGQHPHYEVAVHGDRTVDAVDSAEDEASALGSTTITPSRPLADVVDADLVVVPGYRPPHLAVEDGFLDALRTAHANGARILAVCTGVFALAAAGLLDGRTVTTHWRHADELRAACPGAEVRERLLVEDGELLTSAGASAGFDACLHVVRTDLGATTEDTVARSVVSPPPRAAEEPQYSTLPTPPRQTLRATRQWVIDDLGATITVQAMADHSHLSRRTFVRHFQRETGMPPMRWVLEQRIVAARRLLETSDWPIERIADATGFGTAANLRARFRRETGQAPSAYRARYAEETAHRAQA